MHIKLVNSILLQEFIINTMRFSGIRLIQQVWEPLSGMMEPVASTDYIQVTKKHEDAHRYFHNEKIRPLTAVNPCPTRVCLKLHLQFLLRTLYRFSEDQRDRVSIRISSTEQLIMPLSCVQLERDISDIRFNNSYKTECVRM